MNYVDDYKRIISKQGEEIKALKASLKVEKELHERDMQNSLIHVRETAMKHRNAVTMLRAILNIQGFD